MDFAYTLIVDALAFHCGWPLARTSNFTVEHAPVVDSRHNEIRDLTATLLTKFCNEVTVEQFLQEVTNESMMMHSAITILREQGW